MPTVRTPRRMLTQRELSSLIARYLATLEVPTRIPTVRELARTFGASVGAVQNVLSRLDASGAVTLEARLRAGTTLQSLSITRLWSESHPEPLVIALLPPGTPRVQGLATAVKAALTDQGIETYLIFARGSRRRTGALHRFACDAVIMSALGASSGACGPDERLAAVLPLRTYASRHRVYVRQRALESETPLRVACDPDSADLQSLLDAEFRGAPIEYVYAAYLQHAQLLRDGAVDVVVWDEEDAPPLPTDVVRRSLAPHVDPLGDAATQAVVVTRQDDVLTARMLAECLSPQVIVEVQEAVLAGLRVPEY